MMRYISIFFLSITFFVSAQDKLQHIDPPFWWVGMPTEELQIMLYGEAIGSLDVSIDYAGVEIEKIERLENENYLVINLKVDQQAKAGKLKLLLQKNRKTVHKVIYELKNRNTDSNRHLGFNSSDVIYLLMPDRFANGNPKNDSVDGMLEKVDRSNPNGRHGGDLAGLSENLQHIKELGMTAFWLTPTFENDMTPAYGAYHGYAATDLYQVDRRFGTNEEFQKLVQKAHDNGLKVIMDMIHNHIGDQHWWMKDLPSSDWVHSIEKYGTTNYRGIVQSDPYASQHDKDRLLKGWFVASMPDLDQRNPVLAKYLIQNSIWWIEYSGVDGIRMDTYVYPYKEYLADWTEEVLSSYPNFNIVGEAWVEEVVHEAYWQQNATGVVDQYDSKLPSITDFQVMFALDPGLKNNFGWRDGLSKLYYAASQDALYSDPMKNVIFMDNHDTERFFTRMDENADLFKMGYSYLMTMRGIPQVYYGTEFMWPNAPVEGDGRKRVDMPGGWPDDSRSVFIEAERTAQEQDAFTFVKKLTQWRKNSNPIHQGRLLHFIPENNTYVFFRYMQEEAVMVIMNKNQEKTAINPARFVEILSDYNYAFDVLAEVQIDITKTFHVPGLRTSIFELRK